MALDWLYFEPQTIVIVVSVILLLIIAAVFDRKNRSFANEDGFLPFPTSRGDCIFVGLLLFIYTGLIWLLTVHQIYGLSMWGGFAIGAALFALTLEKG